MTIAEPRDTRQTDVVAVQHCYLHPLLHSISRLCVHFAFSAIDQNTCCCAFGRQDEPLEFFLTLASNSGSDFLILLNPSFPN
jgi:hypothetical protein